MSRSKVSGMLVLGLVAGFVLAGTVLAKDKEWKKIGEFTSGRDAKEVKYSGQVSVCRIKCVEGTVIINTLVVRNGGEKRPVKVTAKIPADKHIDVQIGTNAPVTGFRISDGSRGKYQVLVK